jgi:hypothetical protein
MTSKHRYVQSYEPGEDWYWDFATEQMLSGFDLGLPTSLALPTSHPAGQPVPGPSGYVPSDWMSKLH